MNKRPGGELATRPLHFIWICDCSGSMAEGGKIQVLNNAIRDAIPEMRKIAAQNPSAQVLVRAIKFSDGAQWHIPQPIPIEHFEWTNLSAGGVTDMGQALAVVADQLKTPPMPDHALPPVLVLISDGQPTDSFGRGLKALIEQPWGKRAVRIAIAIGQDADHEALQRFIGHLELKPLQANNPEGLIKQIRWASTVAMRSAWPPVAQLERFESRGGVLSDAEVQTDDFKIDLSLSNHKQVVFMLADCLRQLRDFSEKLDLQTSVELIDDVLKRIVNDSFSIAVVGEFKRGKSTFINALLGQDVLPSDVLPATATLNRVTYGLKPLVKVLFKDGREDEVAIDQLSNYVTKLTPESEATAATVKEAIIYHPVHYCQNNVDIIDTPGLSDNVNMTEVTLSVLPQVDAAILIMMAQSPFSEVEQDFLENKLLANDLGNVIFVVNGIDHFNRLEDGDRVVKFVVDRINKFVLQQAEQKFGKDSEEYKVYLRKIGEPKVFGLSAYQALQAKRKGDAALLTQSCFPQFESALEKFLMQDRGLILLQVSINRVLASASEIIKTISIQAETLKMRQEQLRTVYETSVTEIRTLRQRKTEEMKPTITTTEDVKSRVAEEVNRLKYFVNSVDQILNRIEMRFVQIGADTRYMRFKPISQIVNNHTFDTLDKLKFVKSQVKQEIESSLDNTQNTLAELRGKYEALTESEHKKLNEIHSKAKKILRNAQRLSEQLIQAMNV